MMAASGGNLELVQKLKEKELRKCGNQLDKIGYTALMYAVEGHHANCTLELKDEAGM